MPGLQKHHFKHGFLILLLVVSAAGWSYVIYNQRKSNDPLEVVRKHFVFYPEYGRGLWQEKACPQSGERECREVNYTVPVPGCGAIQFRWRVFPVEDAEPRWSYEGPIPDLDETRYPLYAVLNEDSRLIDSPARGRPLPGSCQLK